MQRISHTSRITSSTLSNSLSLRRQGSNSRPGSSGRQYNAAAEGGASSSLRLDSSEPPNDVNPAVAEALHKVAEALAVAEETAQKVDTLPSARLPTIVRYSSSSFFLFIYSLVFASTISLYSSKSVFLLYYKLKLFFS